MLNIINFIFLGTAGWGASLYLIKILLTSLQPDEIVLYRMLIGFISLVIVAIVAKERVDNIKTLFKDGVIFGLLNMTLPFYLTTVAERHVSSSVASAINGLTPIVTMTLAYFIFLDKSADYKKLLAGAMLGFFGILIINLDKNIQFVTIYDILALLFSCVCYGMAANYIKFYAHTKSVILLSLVAAFVSSVFMFIYKIMTDHVYPWHLPSSVAQYAAIIWLGSISSGLCLVFYCQLIKRIGSSTASLLTYLMILTGVILGVFSLHESMSTFTLCGCVCIFVSLITVSISRYTPKSNIINEGV